MNEPLPASYEFGPFSVDAGRRLLLRNGDPVPLAPKVLETLLVLIENRERVLSKDELLKQVWGDTIVEEGGLTRNISVLRKSAWREAGGPPVHRDGAGPRISVRGGGARKTRQRRIAGRARPTPIARGVAMETLSASLVRSGAAVLGVATLTYPTTTGSSH